ncbi:MAG: metallophosphoesterase [Myxococcales bacterium]|nr:metallophosphoesterase [Myxococcales bacterium]
MRILHFSDVHLEGGLDDVPWQELAGKRALAVVNLVVRRRARFRDAPRKLEALASFAREQGVDLALCTGDWTAIGTHPDLAVAARHAHAFAALPHGLLTVAGNHDVYLPDAVADGRFARHLGWAARYDDDALRTASEPLPFVRLFDGVAVVGVDSARPNPEPWKSSGRVPAAQLAALDRVLRLPAVRERFVVIATHYAPRLWDGRPDRWFHGLENADALLGICARVDRGLFVHGHVHRRYVVRLKGLRIPVFCAGSATERGHESAWMYDIGEGSVRACPLTWRESGWQRGDWDDVRI